MLTCSSTCHFLHLEKSSQCEETVGGHLLLGERGAKHSNTVGMARASPARAQAHSTQTRQAGQAWR